MTIKTGLIIAGAFVVSSVLLPGCSARQCPTGYHEENGECVANYDPNRNPEEDVGNKRQPAPKPYKAVPR
ncbi:MAG: hypothetical protein GXP49_14270 [Deltaproteobacteria bacterium]|nr:hypothetical protein [Deltaproteobacteria bacterium]